MNSLLDGLTPKQRASKKWRDSHKEYISIHRKKYYRENKEKFAEYNKNHRPQLNKYHDKWLSRNKEKSSAITRRWLKNHKKHVNNRLKNWRHSKGISKVFISQFGISKTKEYKKTMQARRRALDKDLKINTVQLVYEDNIKQYGTLTCYLCLELIPFGKDHLEHKIPLCRGGTNEYNNLAVACQPCNYKKHTKTEEEYRSVFHVKN
jgi:5-methylcytosine-specific restriction endonuclease McrA